MRASIRSPSWREPTLEHYRFATRIGEFPFVDDASRANALALFITPEIRHAIVGNVPMGLVDAPQAGSGKSLLVSVVSEKTTGSAAAMKPAPIRDDEEWRKTLTATAQLHDHCF
jgi:hypothetical protein